MATYEVSLRRSAEKDLQKLDPIVQRRVLRAIDGLAGEPRPVGVQKLAGSEDVYRIRVGDYRIIYSIDDAVLIVGIEKIRHRSQAYR